MQKKSFKIIYAWLEISSPPIEGKLSENNITHMELGWLEAEVSEGVSQLPLCLNNLGQLIGQSLSEPDHVLVLSLVVAQKFDLGL